MDWEEPPVEEQRQAGRLPHELQEFGLPVLERRREELREELDPLEALTVLLRLVPLRNLRVPMPLTVRGPVVDAAARRKGQEGRA